MGKFTQNLINKKRASQGLAPVETQFEQEATEDIVQQQPAAPIATPQEAPAPAPVAQPVAPAGTLAPEPVGAPPISPVADERQAEADLRQQLVYNVMQEGTVDADGNWRPVDAAEAEQRVDAELDRQENPLGRDQVTPIGQTDYDPDGFQSSALQAQKDGGFTADAVSNVLSMGRRLDGSINEIFPQALNQDTSEVGTKLKDSLNTLGVIDTFTGNIDPRVGNAAVITLLEVMDKQQRDVHDKAGTDVEGDIDHLSALDNLDNLGTVTDGPTGAKYAPKNAGALFRGVVEKLGGGQQAQGEVRTQYGVQPGLLDSDAAAVADTLLWEALKEQGFVDEVKPQTDNERQYAGENETYFRFTPTAQDFYRETRKLGKKLGEQGRIEPGRIPSLKGETYGRERELRSAKATSVKTQHHTTKESKEIENNVKDALGRIPLAIDQTRFGVAKLMVEHAASQLEANTAAGTPWIPTAFGSILGLDKSKYDKVLANAKTTIATAEAKGQPVNQTAEDIAAGLMQAALAELQQDITDGDAYTSGVFYNKWFNAASNGRYHILNNVLNTQDSKLARGFIGNAKPVFTYKGNGNENRAWLYILGRNLWDTKGVSTVEETIRQARERLPQWGQQGMALKQALASGDPVTIENAFRDNGIDDKGEWSFHLQSLLDAAEYAAAPAGQKIQVKAQVEQDGKANGIAIQAMQEGNVDILEQVGLIFDPEANNIQTRELRQSFWANKDGVIDNIFGQVPEQQAAWKAFFARIEDKKGRATAAKELAKQPMMETSYGKDADFHKESAKAYFQANLQDARDLRNYYNTDEEMEDALNKIIAGSIKGTINLKHQEVMKQTAMFYAALGIDPVIKGPLGNDIQFGRKEFRATGELEIQVGGRTVKVEAGTAEATGQAAKKTPYYYDPKTKKYKKGRQYFGQTVVNQMPVLTIQQIDAAIMAQTINKVNPKGTEAKFVLPIHDAIITDASSVMAYHSEINNQFVNVNRNYNLPMELKTAIDKAYHGWLRSINADDLYQIGPAAPKKDGKELKALWGFFDMHDQRIKQAEEEGRSAPKRSMALVQAAKKAGWLPLSDIDGGTQSLTGRQVAGLAGIVYRATGKPATIPGEGGGNIDEWIRNVNASRPAVEKKIREQRGRTYQYN